MTAFADRAAPAAEAVAAEDDGREDDDFQAEADGAAGTIEARRVEDRARCC